MSLEAEIERIKASGGVESESHLMQRKEIKKKSKDLENGTFVPISTEFSAKLQTALNKINEEELDGAVHSVLKATFQADSLIACQRTNGLSDLIISRDNDFSALVGKQNVQVSNFTFRQSKLRKEKNLIQSMQIIKLELKGASNEIFTKIQAEISKETKSKVTFAPAQYPLFDRDNIFTRSIIAVALGCDVLVGGCKGKGPAGIAKDVKRIENKYESKPDLVNESLVDFFSKKMKLNKTEFEVFCHAFISEPGVEAGTNADERNASHYMSHSVPQTLPKYLKEFKSEKTDIYDGPEIQLCIGPFGGKEEDGDGQHIFLSCEGSKMCKRCNATCCMLCVSEKSVCNGCYHFISFLELANDDDEPDVKKMMNTNIKSIADM